MRILITGARGFIGQNMVKALKDEHEVTTFDWGETIPSIRDHDWVIHLGAHSVTTDQNVEHMMGQNYDFSRWIAAECQNYGVNLQYASSSSVYGLRNNFAEDAPVNPLNPYAWSKVMFDRYVIGLKYKWKIVIQGFRYFNVYGPHEDHKGEQASPYHKFTEQAKRSGVIQLFEGSENFKRDFVPVNTVTDVHKLFFNVKESGIWNVGTGVAKSFQEVAEEIAKEYNARIEYIPIPDNIKNQYQTYTCADLTKIKKYYNP